MVKKLECFFWKQRTHSSPSKIMSFRQNVPRFLSEKTLHLSDQGDELSHADAHSWVASVAQQQSAKFGALSLEGCYFRDSF